MKYSFLLAIILCGVNLCGAVSIGNWHSVCGWFSAFCLALLTYYEKNKKE